MILPDNDGGCGWLNVLPARKANPPLSETRVADWVIIGAGYTGLSAARRLAQLHPQDSIVILEANDAGAGASARNSGYLVDSTLNDGHLSDAGLEAYQSKYQLNLTALKRVESLVNDQNIDCDWNPCGKYHATALSRNEAKLEAFAKTLASCDIGHTIVQKQELAQQLGTDFYRLAVHTNGGVMLQPAKLARGMIHCLPEQVELYENSPVTRWTENAEGVEVSVGQGQVRARKLLICSNGFIPQLGLQQDRVLPLTLTASLTRPLTDSEFAALGQPTEWGVLSAQAMGATVRLTQDRRIMIRNTAEAWQPINMSSQQCQQRMATHRAGFLKRFPALADVPFEHSWSGVTCISGNSANLFARLSTRVFVAGCYNGGGIGLATLFGEELALLASDGDSPELRQIQQRPKPNWLPPQPFLRWGVKARLSRDRWRAKAER